MLHRIAESEMKRCDVLIVGAGFSGLVMAERLSNELGKHCIVARNLRPVYL
jgi:cation diffusion facilitator CzcD-associated flavoprotein CzcO